MKENNVVSLRRKDEADGRRRVVRDGHDPARAIQTGIGPVEVRKPKARDRDPSAQARIRFIPGRLNIDTRPMPLSD